MNLIKSFNFKFLMQTLKKSKGILILSLIIVPLLTSLFIIANSIESDRSQILIDFSTYGFLDYVLLYIIPFAYSSMFFGFVYKKKSIDFIESMPVNRKTVFVTGTIGGIALIVIMQFLVVAVISLVCLITPNLALVGMPALNFFLIMCISYIFVFIAANLAMTISGTAITQLVITVLIIFFIPICFDVCKLTIHMGKNNMRYYSYYDYYDNDHDYDLEIYNGNKKIGLNILTSDTSYTMPYNIIRRGNYYTNKSIIKTIVLGIAYFFLGLKLFKTKKMENSEQSFGSEKAHIVLKGLPLIPLMLLININVLREGLGFVNVIIIAMFAIYYFLFDYIVKKKIKFTKTVVYFIFTLIIIWFGTAGFNTIITNINQEKQIDLDDIKAISLNSGYDDLFIFGSFTNYYDSNSNKELDERYFIEDETLNKLLFDAIYERQNSKENYRNMYDGYDYGYNYYEESKYIKINIKLNSGKTYSVETSISKSNYDKIAKLITEDDEYNAYYIKKMLNSQGKFLDSNLYVFNNKMQSKISRELKKAKEDIKISDFIVDQYPMEHYTFTKYAYVDHKIKSYVIPVNITENVLQVIADYENSKVAKKLNSDYANLEFLKIYNKDNEQVDLSQNTYNYSNDYGYTNTNKVLEFAEKYASNEFDVSKPYYILEMHMKTYDRKYNSEYTTFTLFTNKVDEVENTFFLKN